MADTSKKHDLPNTVGKYIINERLYPYARVVSYYDSEKANIRRTADGLYAPTKVAKDSTSTPTYMEGARQYALKTVKHALPIFAREFYVPESKKKEISRTFITGAYSRFYNMYTGSLGAPCRWFHEVIDSEEPCHLYYDLDLVYKDFSDTNPGRLYGPDVLLNLFTALMRKCLVELLPVKEEDIEFVHSESCTPEKFSVHGVVHGIPVFRNSQDVRQVIAYAEKRCCELLNEPVKEGGDMRSWQPLMWTPKEVGRMPNQKPKQPQFIADLAVYAKNHSLRLVGSSKPYQKGEKGRYLVPLPTKQHVKSEDFLAEKRVEMKANGVFDLPLNVFTRHLVQHITAGMPIIAMAIPGLDQQSEDKPMSNLPSAWYPKHPLLFDRLLCTMEELLAKEAHTIAPTASSSSTSTSITAKPFIGTMPVKFSRQRLKSLPGPYLRVRVDTTTTYCPLARTSHHGNHQYAVIDFRQNGFFMRCYRPRCTGVQDGHAFKEESHPLVLAIRNGTPLPTVPPPLTLSSTAITTSAHVSGDGDDNENDDAPIDDYDSDFPTAESSVAPVAKKPMMPVKKPVVATTAKAKPHKRHHRSKRKRPAEDDPDFFPAKEDGDADKDEEITPVSLSGEGEEEADDEEAEAEEEDEDDEDDEDENPDADYKDDSD